MVPAPLNIRPGKFIPVDGNPMKLTDCHVEFKTPDAHTFTGVWHTSTKTDTSAIFDSYDSYINGWSVGVSTNT